MRLLSTFLLCLTVLCRLGAQNVNSTQLFQYLPTSDPVFSPAIPFQYTFSGIENCDNGIDDDGDGYVDCYDPDCSCYPVIDCSGPAPEQFGGSLAWKNPEDFYSWQVTPLVANLNPWADQLPEIVILKLTLPFSYDIHIYRGDGSNAQQPDVVQVPDGISPLVHNQLAIGDLDNDGRPELIAVDQKGFMNIFQDYTPGALPAMQLWLKSDKPVESSTHRPQLADFNGDGIAEIYAGNAIFKLDLTDPGSPKLIKVLDANGPEGAVLDSYGGASSTAPTAPTIADLLSLADCNGDPDCAGLELVAGGRIWSVDIDPLDGDPMQIKPARTLNTSQWGDGYTAVNDLDADGTPDVIVNSLHNFNGVTEYGIYVWDKDGLKYFLPHPVSNKVTGGGLLCIANIFDDREMGYAEDLPEILAVSENRLSCYNLNMAQTNPQTPWWWSIDVDDPSGSTACTVFDLNGDGLLEIIYRDESYLRILYGGSAPFPAGVDTNRNWWMEICGSGTINEYPVVADVDHDGQAEIVVTGLDEPYGPGTELSYLRVYESAGMPWMPARPLWNQFNYNSIQVNDDLSIPAQPQPHWLEFPVPGSSKRPLNLHLVQVPLLNKNFDPVYPFPDGAISADSVYCDAQNLYLRLQVCNVGNAPLSDSMPVQFYLDDPTAAAVSPYGAPILLTAPIGIGACTDFTVQIPMPPPGILWGILNNNGSQPTPLSLSTDFFQSAGSEECQYENNLFMVQVNFSPDALDLGPDTAKCNEDILLLDAGAGFAAYHWQDGSTNSQYAVSNPGEYWVEVWDICGNKSTDTIEVGSISAPTASYTIQFYPGQSVTLNGQVYIQPETVIITKPSNTGGCDSLLTYFLELLPAPELDTVCDLKTPPGCLRYELLGIRLDSLGHRRYRVRLTNTCVSPLQYICIQLPKGVTAVLPDDSDTYTSNGNNYTVRNPNASPFYSIRFKAQTDGPHDGQNAVFEYSLPQQLAPDYIHVYAKLNDGSTSEAHLNTFYCPVQPWSGAANRNTLETVLTPVSLQVWPNPSKGYLLIDRSASPDQPLWLRVWNTQGQVVYEARFNTGSAPMRVNFPDRLANGMYYLLVGSEDCAVTRFVVER